MSLALGGSNFGNNTGELIGFTTTAGRITTPGTQVLGGPTIRADNIVPYTPGQTDITIGVVGGTVNFDRLCAKKLCINGQIPRNNQWLQLNPSTRDITQTYVNHMQDNTGTGVININDMSGIDIRNQSSNNGITVDPSGRIIFGNGKPIKPAYDVDISGRTHLQNALISNYLVEGISGNHILVTTPYGNAVWTPLPLVACIEKLLLDFCNISGNMFSYGYGQCVVDQDTVTLTGEKAIVQKNLQVGGCAAVYGDLGVCGNFVYKPGAIQGGILTGDASGYANWMSLSGVMAGGTPIFTGITPGISGNYVLVTNNNGTASWVPLPKAKCIDELLLDFCDISTGMFTYGWGQCVIDPNTITLTGEKTTVQNNLQVGGCTAIYGDLGLCGKFIYKNGTISVPSILTGDSDGYAQWSPIGDLLSGMPLNFAIVQNVPPNHILVTNGDGQAFWQPLDSAKCIENLLIDFCDVSTGMFTFGWGQCIIDPDTITLTGEKTVVQNNLQVGGCTAIYGDLGVCGRFLYKRGAVDRGLLISDSSGFGRWQTLEDIVENGTPIFSGKTPNIPANHVLVTNSDGTATWVPLVSATFIDKLPIGVYDPIDNTFSYGAAQCIVDQNMVTLTGEKAIVQNNLQIGGSTSINGDLGVLGKLYFTHNRIEGGVLQSDASGYATWANVGLNVIGENTFINSHIHTGAISISNSLYIDGSAVFIGQTTIEGDLNVTGNVFALNVSDRRVKRELRQLDSNEIAEKAQKWGDLPIYEYEYDLDRAPSHLDKTRKHVGFMAQDVATISPVAITQTTHNLDTGDKIIGIDWLNTILPEEIPVIIKHLISENRSMRNEIAELRSMVRDFATKLG